MKQELKDVLEQHVRNVAVEPNEEDYPIFGKRV